MKARNSKIWNSENLVQFGGALGSGYIPGLGPDSEVGDRWTARRHAQVSLMLGHGYNPGV